MAPFIRLTALTKRFDEVVAVDNLSLDIEKGELFCLLGASGCGKSTLLRMLAGFEQPSAGSIEIDGFCGRFDSYGGVRGRSRSW